MKQIDNILQDIIKSYNNCMTNICRCMYRLDALEGQVADTLYNSRVRIISSIGCRERVFITRLYSSMVNGESNYNIGSRGFMSMCDKSEEEVRQSYKSLGYVESSVEGLPNCYMYKKNDEILIVMIFYNSNNICFYIGFPFLTYSLSVYK